jgi:hypothetical protein
MQVIHARVREIIDAAGAAGVQVLCLQEAWHMPFALCTREKQWTEFAEPVGGPSTQLCQALARKHGMVLVSPILERDEAHAGTIWNTAVVVGNNGNVIGKHRKVRTMMLKGLLPLVVVVSMGGWAGHLRGCGWDDRGGRRAPVSVLRRRGRTAASLLLFVTYWALRAWGRGAACGLCLA